MSEPAGSKAAPSAAISAPVFPLHVREEALSAVGRYSLMAAATPFIPVPGLDSLSVSGIQLAMIAELSRRYGQTFSKDIAQSLAGAAGGGLLSYLFSRTAPAAAMKNLVLAVPIFGPLLRWGAGPAALAAYTYLLGMAFIQHYETGGRFEDFNRRHFIAYVQKVLREQAGLGPFSRA